MAAPAPVLWDVVEEHLDEAAFLSGQWEAALVSPVHTLASVANGPEERLRAHIDGLLVAGPAARERVVEPALASDDREEVFAAALALLESGGREYIDRVFARLDRCEPELTAALTRALELAHRPGIEDELLAAARSGSPRRVAPALEALAFRRVLVPLDILRDAGATEVPAVVRSALAAARWAGAQAHPLVEREASSTVVAVRDAAIETGVVLGLRSAWGACRAAAEAMEPGSAFPLLALALRGAESDVETIAQAVRFEALRPAALFALGFTGRIAAADVALAHLRDEKAGRIAGEAFSAITGLVIERELQAPEPEKPEEPIPFEREDLDADLVPGPEAMLPLPVAEAVEAWWKKARAKLDPGARYLGGKPYAADAAHAALIDGAMRRRHALALEVAIRSRGEYALQTRGWATDQLRHHGEHRVAPRAGFGDGFGKLLQG